MSFFNELKRRNVFRMGVAYVVVAWVLLQAIDFALDIISAPNWIMQVFFLAAVAGLPLVLIFSWIFEMTPEGIKFESEVDRSQSVTPHTGRKLDRTIMVFLAVAVMLLLADRLLLREDMPTSIETNTAIEQVADESPASKVKSVAVLPFVNMSSDPEQEYFSDGLAEELLNRLAKNDRLHVAARTSSFQFKGQNQDIAEIGKQLKVAHVLEGSVRKSSNRLRITAQLIEVDSGFHLWSETYEREMDDIFAIQDDISQAITRALEAELGAVSTSTEAHPTKNLEAYQLYLEARYLLAKRGEGNMLKAHGLFEQAVGLDPEFSRAWSSLAYNYSLLPSYGGTVSTNQAWEIVNEAATKAIQLDSTSAEAYVALGRANMHDDFKTIQQLYEKAYELAPNNTDVINFYADFLVIVGDFQAAERLERKAIELDPLAAVHHSDLVFVLVPLGRYEEALIYGRNSARLEPDSVDRADALVYSLIMAGLHDEAVETIRYYEQRHGSDHESVNWWWCLLYYNQGNEQKLREKLTRRLNSHASGTGVFGETVTAFFITWLDGTKAGLPWFKEAQRTGDWNINWPDYVYLPEIISEDPEWLAFWQQPRLAELMEIRRSNQTQEHIGLWKERTVK